MIDTSVKLISKVFSTDSYGNEVATESLIEVPIIRIESIYANEFYRGNQAGFKPSKRIVISSLNYSNQDELEYNSTRYTIIRTEEANNDELILILEVKIYEY